MNECGTQLVLCDINADCVNGFGSYSCRCRPGFRDGSRLGSGGTACIDTASTGSPPRAHLAAVGMLTGCGLPAGLAPGVSPEAKGVYALFFLLSSLVLMLLAAAGLLYHRHRRGAFQVPGPSNNRSHDDCGPAERQLPPLPPPPPPTRAFRESWPRVKECCPAVELPLLRFSPLMMDGCKEPKERGKI